jgi:hypothetical protein
MSGGTGAGLAADALLPFGGRFWAAVSADIDKRTVNVSDSIAKKLYFPDIAFGISNEMLLLFFLLILL